MIKVCFNAGMVPMLRGSPGLGKSDIVHGIARENNFEVIDMRLSQSDPTDLNGFPKFTGDRAGYAPMDTFPLETDELPEGKNGWVLFLDEFNSAPLSVQAAAYKLVLDRRVGKFKLHDRVFIVCAGNKEDDGAIVNETSTAMQSRLVHMELVVDLPEWLNWAAKNDISPMITSYLQFKPDHIYTFKPNHEDLTYACPRTWAFANKLMKLAPPGSIDFFPLMAGALSEGVGAEFNAYTKVYLELPNMADIMKDPANIRVSEDPSVLYALTGALSHHATKDNIAEMLKFINRMPAEFQVITVRDMVRRDKELWRVPAMVEWVAKAGKEYLY